MQLRRQFQALVFSNAWVRKFKKKRLPLEKHKSNININNRNPTVDICFFAFADTVLSLLLVLLLLLVSVFFLLPGCCFFFCLVVVFSFAWLLFFWPFSFVSFRCLPFCFPFLLIVVSFFCSSFSSPYETKNK